ncbi:hypothetical protein VNO77_43627 [Canavalia gladiata]|uniref:Uncharacterized protein n=1 Tax=Canavalia gladiata TaxID=3824 RepID=A0AAN9PQ28_CANGL
MHHRLLLLLLLFPGGVVDGKSYTSPATFAQQKAAEQDIAMFVNLMFFSILSSILWIIYACPCEGFRASLPIGLLRTYDVAHTISLEVAGLVAANNMKEKNGTSCAFHSAFLVSKSQLLKHIRSLEVAVTQLPNLNLLPRLEQSSGDRSGIKSGKEQEKGQ